MKNKKIVLILGIVGILLVLTGVTYAFFNYTRTGGANNLGTGRISFLSTQNNTLNLTNLFPVTEDKLNASTLDAVTITIQGDTTYEEGEEYLISLTGVNNTINGKEIPINYIAEVSSTGNIGTSDSDYWNNRETTNSSIYTLNSTGEVKEGEQVLVGFIKNGATGVNGSITIKAYIDGERLVISDTIENGDVSVPGYTNNTTSEWVAGRTILTTTEWNSFQNSATPISFKIRAESNEGIWVEEPPTPESCFTTTSHISYVLNTNSNVNTCVNYLTTNWGEEEEGVTVDIGETYQAFCEGTGTNWGETFQEIIDQDWFTDEDLDFFEEHSIIIDNGYTRTITDYDVTCGSNVVIPSSIENMTVTEVGERAFYNKSISSVKIPNSVTSIGGLAFQWNQLTSVVIPNSVRFIEFSAFYENQLTNVKLSNNLVYIGQGAFMGNHIISVMIPDSVTIIEEFAFSCNHLSSVTMGNSIASIGNYAFSDNQLTNVTISNSVTTIGPSAFSNNQLTNVTIGNSVTTIGGGAFTHNQLTNIIIPNNVTTIGDNAFGGNQLVSVTIGNGITSIGQAAFSKSNVISHENDEIIYYDNPNLTSITINKSCTDIKNNLKVDNDNYYPWLSYGSPYTAPGVTIYGANNEVCDSW